MLNLDQCMGSVVALGVKTNPRNTQWYGSGFFVRKTYNIQEYFLITNYHVIDAILNDNFINIQVLYKPGINDIPKCCEIPIYNNNTPQYSFINNADVVALKIPENLINDIDENSVINLSEESDFKNIGLLVPNFTEGTNVCALGFSKGIVDYRSHSPFYRHGCVSTHPFLGNNVPECSTFYIDAQTLPGDSGGPIFGFNDQNENRMYLIGILCSSMLSRTNDNSVLTKVFPVDAIIKVIDAEHNRD